MPGVAIAASLRIVTNNYGPLYHYTTATGLLGILRSRSIWLTDSHFLNDETEQIYAAKLLRAGLAPDQDAELIQLLNELYLGPEIRLPAHETPLLASFCRNGDLLSMWRGYGNGGFCIEFDPKALLAKGIPSWQRLGMTEEEARDAEVENFPVSHAHLVEVVYGEVESIKRKIAASDDKRSALANSLIKVKHPAFAEEQEIRLVSFAASCMSGPPEIRVVDGRLIPFRALTFPHQAIRSITVGPGPNQTDNREVIDQWLSRFGSGRGEWSHVRINQSVAPLRG